jgi:hypothetical protein
MARAHTEDVGNRNELVREREERAHARRMRAAQEVRFFFLFLRPRVVFASSRRRVRSRHVLPAC